MILMPLDSPNRGRREERFAHTRRVHDRREVIAASRRFEAASLKAVSLRDV